MRILLTTIVLLALSVACITNAQNLPELAKKQGAVEVVKALEYRPTTLKELSISADVVVEGIVLTDAASLTPDQSSVYTAYTVQVLQYLKGEDNASRATRLTVRRPGGTVFVESGKRVTVTVGEHGMLERSQNYVLFLRYDPQSLTYEVLFGPQGVLPIQNGVVSQPSGMGPWDEEIAAMSIDAFRDAVASYARSKPKNP